MVTLPPICLCLCLCLCLLLRSLVTACSPLGHRLAQNENLADALDHVTRKARLAKAWNVWVGMMEDMMLLELAACI